MSRHHVTIEPLGFGFQVDADMPLLHAASAAGIVLPSSCRNGTCRACMCRSISGIVSYRIDWPGLSREEKQEGWILPCCAFARADLVIEAPLAKWAEPAFTNLA